MYTLLSQTVRGAAGEGEVGGKGHAGEGERQGEGQAGDGEIQGKGTRRGKG